MLQTTADARPNSLDPHRGFRPGSWLEGVDVRDFIQRNYTPFSGDAAFVAGPSDRTTRVWGMLHDLMLEEHARGGVLDVDASTPSTITAHAPGYIGREDELIVGLQTDAPLRRAIFPNGGWRMVEAGLRAYGFEPDERVREIFTKYRKTHNDGVFDAYTPEILAAPGRRRHRPAGRLRPRPHHRRLPPRGALRGRPADRVEASGADRARPGVRERGRHPRPRGAGRADPRAG